MSTYRYQLFDQRGAGELEQQPLFVRDYDRKEYPTEVEWYSQALRDAIAEGVDLSWMMLCTGTYRRIDFRGVDISNADLLSVTFVDCDFTDCDLSGATLGETVFMNCKMQGIKLPEGIEPAHLTY